MFSVVTFDHRAPEMAACREKRMNPYFRLSYDFLPYPGKEQSILVKIRDEAIISRKLFSPPERKED